MEKSKYLKIKIKDSEKHLFHFAVRDEVKEGKKTKIVWNPQIENEETLQFLIGTIPSNMGIEKVIKNNGIVDVVKTFESNSDSIILMHNPKKKNNK